MNDIINIITENQLLVVALIYIYSAILISFSNVIIYRLPIMIDFESARLIKAYIKHDDRDVNAAYEAGLGLGLSKPNSRCNNCLGEIKFYRNIPIISYLLNRGRCHHCKEKYSPTHFFTELILPVFPVLAYLYYGLTYTTLFFIAFLFISYIITVIDFKHKIIPNQLVIAMCFIIALFTTTEYSTISTQQAIINMSITYVVLNIFYKLINIRYAFGYGDVKLLIILSALFNLEVFVHMMLLASIIGLVEMLTVKKFLYKEDSPELAFGPSIVIASIIMFILERLDYINIVYNL